MGKIPHCINVAVTSTYLYLEIDGVDLPQLTLGMWNGTGQHQKILCTDSPKKKLNHLLIILRSYSYINLISN